MSDLAEPAAARSERTVAEPQNRVIELKVSGHLMTLDAGLFCIFQPPGSAQAAANGLPGVRISLPPAQLRRPDSVMISTFRDDGWLNGGDGAALVRVNDGPAQVLVTVYQAPGAPAEAAPRLQVMRLGSEAASGRTAERARSTVPPDAEIVAHVQRTGDVGGAMGEWIGVRGSQLWIEGFGIKPPDGLAASDLEYQAVLGRGWVSPWVEGGKFCGSRGMALPLLGLRVRVKGEAAASHEVALSATFVDGNTIGPVGSGEACETDSLAALEAFQLSLRPLRDEEPKPAAAKKPAKRPR